MKKLFLVLILLLNPIFCQVAFSDDDDTSTVDTNTDSAYSISIVSPTQDDTLHNDEPLTISVAITPGLETNDTVEFFVDGVSVGDPVHATSISLPPLERGEHTVQAKLIGKDGEKATSDIVTLYDQKHSILLGPGPSPKTEVNQFGSNTSH